MLDASAARVKKVRARPSDTDRCKSFPAVADREGGDDR